MCHLLMSHQVLINTSTARDSWFASVSEQTAALFLEGLWGQDASEDDE